MRIWVSVCLIKVVERYHSRCLIGGLGWSPVMVFKTMGSKHHMLQKCQGVPVNATLGISAFCVIWRMGIFV